MISPLRLRSSLFIAGKNIGAILLPLKDSLTNRMPLKATIILSAIVVNSEGSKFCLRNKTPCSSGQSNLFNKLSDFR